MHPKKLEHYKYFAPIAWTICLGFAGFVGMMALQLGEQVQTLGDSSISHEQRLQDIEAAIGINNF